MTPDEIRERKERGLKPTEEDVLWLLDLTEELAKAVVSFEPADFGCPVCRREEGHSGRCPMPLAEAVLRGRWQVTS